VHRVGMADEARGSVINYLGNPCFHPHHAFKMAGTIEEMEQRRQLLTDHAIVISDEGPLGVRSREEVKDIILHHFGIRKHDFFVYCSSPEPFVAFFHETNARDEVLTAARVVDGPIELGFCAWDLDYFGERDIIPFMSS
jgi:hypothetical protein